MKYSHNVPLIIGAVLLGLMVNGVIVAFAIFGDELFTSASSHAFGEKPKDAETPPERIVYVERPKPPLRLKYGWSAGTLMVHDLYVTNTSGEDLSEVHVTVTFIGENATEKVTRYWMNWPLGEKQDVQMSVDKVRNVQRILVQGKCDQGVFSDDLSPQG